MSSTSQLLVGQLVRLTQLRRGQGMDSIKNTTLVSKSLNIHSNDITWNMPGKVDLLLQ